MKIFFSLLIFSLALILFISKADFSYAEGDGGVMGPGALSGGGGIAMPYKAGISASCNKIKPGESCKVGVSPGPNEFMWSVEYENPNVANNLDLIYVFTPPVLSIELCRGKCLDLGTFKGTPIKKLAALQYADNLGPFGAASSPVRAGIVTDIVIPKNTPPGSDYTVCASDAGGGAKLCSTPFSILSSLDIPALTYPENGSVLNSLPKLKWNVVSGAEYYPVISRLAASTAITVNASTNEQLFSFADQTYEWSVAACKKQSLFEYWWKNTSDLKIGGISTIEQRIAMPMFFLGIDELKIYNRGLLASEVLDLSKASKVNNGLVGSWSFDEGAGIAVADDSGNNNNGIRDQVSPITGSNRVLTQPGMIPWSSSEIRIGFDCDRNGCYEAVPIYGKPFDPTWLEGKSGKAIQVGDDKSNLVTVKDSKSLNSSAISISVWIKIPPTTQSTFLSQQISQQTARTIVSKSATNAGYLLSLNANRIVNFFDYGNSNNIVSKDAIPIDQWTHVAVTGDQSGLRLYINGKLEADNAKPYGGGIVESCTEWSKPWAFTVKGVSTQTSQSTQQTVQTTTAQTTTQEQTIVPTTQQTATQVVQQSATCDSISHNSQDKVLSLGLGETKSNFCGSPQYFKISIPKDQTCDIKWTLQPDSNSDYDLYVEWKEGILNRNIYDDRSIGGPGQKEELAKTGLAFGDYYAMAYREAKDLTTGSYSITPMLTNCTVQTIQQVINSQQQTAGTNSNGVRCYTFAKTIKYKDTGSAVVALKTALNNEGLLSISNPTTYFGLSTQKAVIAFQEKYKDEILTPYNLTKGTGNVGTATIKKLNWLYGCK